nr:hypothetical protein [Escherichia coli O25b:H4-ST131]
MLVFIDDGSTNIKLWGRKTTEQLNSTLARTASNASGQSLW